MRFLQQQRYLVIGSAACAVAAVSVVYSAVWSLKGGRIPSRRKEPKRVLITGAAGQIAYALAPLIASGQMLGPDQPVVLQLYDVPAALDLLQGLQLELQDAAYPLLTGVMATTDFAAAACGVSIAILCGGVPKRGPGLLSKTEVMAANCAIYRDQAAALAAHAAPGVKVVVVASPVNTNAWLLQQYAPSIPKQDITALTRLDHNRAVQHLAALLDVPVSDITNVIVWGNHASSQFPFGHLAKVQGKPLIQYDWLQQHEHDHQQQLGDLGLEDYLRNEFITLVQNRGAAVGRLRHQLSPALSAAAAVCCHVRDWLTGLPSGCDWVSMGVSSDGSYGIAAGLVYSFPVTCGGGRWAIVKGLPVEAWAWARMKAAEADLLEERNLALQVLACAATAAADRTRAAAAPQVQQQQQQQQQGEELIGSSTSAPTRATAGAPSASVEQQNITAAQQDYGRQKQYHAAHLSSELVHVPTVAVQGIPIQTAAEMAEGLQARIQPAAEQPPAMQPGQQSEVHCKLQVELLQSEADEVVTQATGSVHSMEADEAGGLARSQPEELGSEGSAVAAAGSEGVPAQLQDQLDAGHGEEQTAATPSQQGNSPRSVTH